MKFQAVVITLLFALYMVKISMASVQKEIITPGFQGSQMDYIDNGGFFLLSKDTTFAFGFITFTSSDTTLYLLAVMHQASSQTVWSANPNNPITHSDDFIFSKNGDAYLKSGELTIWSTNTSNAAASMQLLNSGNLVILSSGDSSAAPLWESFLHPTDTLLSGQSFTKETTLVSKPNSQNITYSLSIDSLDMNLFLNFDPPQPYWSMQQDTRKIVNQITGDLQSAIIANNSWTFYNNRGSVLWQFVFTQDADVSNTTWAAVLNNKGVISFINLESSGTSSAIKIPQDPCQSPDACNPYMICYSGSMCTCPEILNSQTNCNPNTNPNPNGASNCSISGDYNLVKLGDGVEYFATKFINPFMKTNLTSCKNACVNNCSCVAVFYENNSGNCYIFNQIASLQQLDTNGNNNISNYLSFIKISSNNNNDTKGSKNHQLVIIIVITLGAVILIAIIIITGLKIKIHRKTKLNLHEPSSRHHHSSSDDEDNVFLEAMSTNPVRFTYKELEYATNNFEIKLGQGGFGSVYLGKLQDGSQIAVKKLEGIGQGKKEFRAEVSIIGSIHHVHLVKLRGFCAEGNYRLLAYEYMSNGSLDKWIFKSDTDKTQTQTLNLNQRFNIALGTAKGLHYLHEDCDSKIIHCDIKPENVLLDSNFTAKVSDFGLAKLMNREQSNVFTTLRGTRGYLAPEWIMNYAISEKSDVYSFGMVLLEIIGGRKSFEVRESGEKMYLPSYAHKMLDEGNVREVVDETVRDDKDIETQERMIKVALWCIQEDLSLRPSMSKVVQMLEGTSETVPKLPPMSGTHMGFRLYKNAINSSSEEAMTSDTGSGHTDQWNSDAMLSAVRLSGPR